MASRLLLQSAKSTRLPFLGLRVNTNLVNAALVLHKIVTEDLSSIPSSAVTMNDNTIKSSRDVIMIDKPNILDGISGRSSFVLADLMRGESRFEMRGGSRDYEDDDAEIDDEEFGDEDEDEDLERAEDMFGKFSSEESDDYDDADTDVKRE